MSIVNCTLCHTSYGLLTAYQHGWNGEDFICCECRIGPPINARFQRNNDGQYVGRLTFKNETVECWLAFSDGSEDAAFLRLTFIDP